MALRFQTDFDLSEDLLNLLNGDSLKSIDTSSVTIPDSAETSEVKTVEFDHQYCSRPHRKSEHSDSGISNDTFSSGGPLSPGNSDSLCDSPRSGMTPRSSQDELPHMSPLNDETADSPLGGGMEDLMLSDLPFDTLDPSSFLTDDDLFSSVIQDGSTNVTLDLGKWHFLQLSHIVVNQSFSVRRLNGQCK